ncbi:TPA: hypothetical protein NH480_002820 [Pseudomonas aeruginosa]|uniref:hypothetical protein n=1 Tax=Pseudomonas aeruginosa TaxID=287 RepID=UPI0021E36AE8|nr:hypothetical protein [Pseudomonas aeruginosa]UYF86595.1 hypothetical protein LLJ53_11320 [Pseudomonas aeruginosa]HCE9854928.1 hypothetical protein [Pseudomonas aeruginosa]
MIAITNKYEFSGINKDFISYIHSRLELISNDDSDFIEAIDSGNPRERISAIDDKILEVKHRGLILGKTIIGVEAIEALTELKERIKHRAKIRD